MARLALAAFGADELLTAIAAPDLEVLRFTGEADLPPDLRPDLLVIGPEISRVPELAAALARRFPGTGIVVVLPEDRLARLRAGLPFTPGLGEAVLASAQLPPEALVRELREAADAANRRRAMSGVMAKINAQLVATPPPAPGHAPDAHLSQRYFATLLSAAPDAFFAIDPESRFLAYNEAASRLFCLDTAGTLARLPDALTDQAAGALRTYLAATIERTAPRSIELELRARDSGGARWIEVSLSAVVEEDGAVDTIAGTAREVTERRRAAERLALSEESFRLATDAAEVGTWDLDLATDVLTWSDRTKAMFGISPGVACSMADFYAGLHPDDLERTSAAFASALDPERRATYDVEYRTVGKEDGALRWVAAKGKGLFDDVGRCVRAIGTAIDITRRKAAEARRAVLLAAADALRSDDAEQGLVAAFRFLGEFLGARGVGYARVEDRLLAPGPAWQVDPSLSADLRHFKLNEASWEGLGSGEPAPLTVTAPSGQPLLLVPLAREGRVRSLLYLASAPGMAESGEEYRLAREIGERASQTIERAEAERAVHVLNATLEARVEERTVELRMAEEALRQSQKMEAVGQLTGGIAHDFNNLLTVITGNMDMAARRLSDDADPRVARALTSALKGAERASTLTQRLLAFSRRQTLAPRATDVGRLVGGMSDLLARSLGEQVEFETMTTAGLWRVEVDPHQLENALLNLAVNARDAMPGGGKLTIEATNALIDRSYASAHPEVAPGQYVAIAVSDNGAGMTPETISRAFDPFYTTKEVGKGTGLGLSMVYGFVKQSGGHVKIYSEVGEGTTIKIYLPRILSEASEVEPAADELAEAGSDNFTILVVEDDDDVRTFSVESLRELGYRVLEAYDGPSALRLLQRQERPIDLLFTDVVMPAMSGRELADAAMRLMPGMNVLYTSGYTRNAIASAGRLEPGVDLIAKPFTFAALSAKVRDVLDRKRLECILVLSPPSNQTLKLVTLLESLGFRLEQAASAPEALGKVRLNEGRYDAVVIDDELPVGRIQAVVDELRALRRDLPVLLVTATDPEERYPEYDGDSCVAVAVKETLQDNLRGKLEQLRVACSTVREAQ